MAQTDNFLKIAPLEGESTDKDHKGWFDLKSFNLNVTQSGSMAWGGGGGTGQAHFGDIPITVNVGKHSPEAMLRCATGKHFDKAEIICRKAGDTPLDYLKIELTDVMITSYQMNRGFGSEPPTESWNLDYAKISYAYQGQDNKGKGLGWVTKYYDVKTNEKG
jgi:type VI secretion system secreted protein Hcp